MNKQLLQFTYANTVNALEFSEHTRQASLTEVAHTVLRVVIWYRCALASH